MTKVTMQELATLDQELSLLEEENDRLALMKTSLIDIKDRIEQDLEKEKTENVTIEAHGFVAEMTQPIGLIGLFQSRPEFKVTPEIDVSGYPNNILQGVSGLIQKHSQLLEKLSELEAKRLFLSIIGIGSGVIDALTAQIQELESSNPHLKFQ